MYFGITDVETLENGVRNSEVFDCVMEEGKRSSFLELGALALHDVNVTVLDELVALAVNDFARISEGCIPRDCHLVDELIIFGFWVAIFPLSILWK